MTTSSSDCPFVFFMRACKCQLFTDEGSRRLPKRLNYCFSVLASATNRSICVHSCWKTVHLAGPCELCLGFHHKTKAKVKNQRISPAFSSKTFWFSRKGWLAPNSCHTRKLFVVIRNVVYTFGNWYWK